MVLHVTEDEKEGKKILLIKLQHNQIFNNNTNML